MTNLFALWMVFHVPSVSIYLSHSFAVIAFIFPLLISPPTPFSIMHVVIVEKSVMGEGWV